MSFNSKIADACIAEAKHKHRDRKQPSHIKRIVERSPVPPHSVTPNAFLQALYPPDSRVLIFTNEGEHSIWTANSSTDATALMGGKLGSLFWPLPCHNDNVGYSFSSDQVTSWPFMIVRRYIDGIEKLVSGEIPIIAVVTADDSSARAIVRVNADSRKEWLAERDRLTPIFEKHESKIMQWHNGMPLPGSIGKDGINRLLYFNPKAPAIAKAEVVQVP